MPCAGKGGRAPGLAGSRILDPSLHTRLCSPVIYRQLRVNSSPPWKFRSKVLLVQRNMIKLGPFVFACVVGFFFSEGTCVGRAAGRAWHTDGQILTIRKSGQRCLCLWRGWNFSWKGHNWSRVGFQPGMRFWPCLELAGVGAAGRAPEPVVFPQAHPEGGLAQGLP